MRTLLFKLVFSRILIEPRAFFLKSLNFTVERGQTLSPEDVQKLIDQGTYRDTINEAIRALHEQGRRLVSYNVGLQIILKLF